MLLSGSLKPRLPPRKDLQKNSSIIPRVDDEVILPNADGPMRRECRPINDLKDGAVEFRDFVYGDVDKKTINETEKIFYATNPDGSKILNEFYIIDKNGKKIEVYYNPYIIEPSDYSSREHFVYFENKYIPKEGVVLKNHLFELNGVKCGRAISYEYSTKPLDEYYADLRELAQKEQK